MKRYIIKDLCSCQYYNNGGYFSVDIHSAMFFMRKQQAENLISELKPQDYGILEIKEIYV